MIVTLRPEEAGMNSRKCAVGSMSFVAHGQTDDKSHRVCLGPFLAGAGFMRYRLYPGCAW